MDFLTSLVNSMPGAVAQGLIWGIMAIGVYITYRILDVADLTVDGSLGTGGAVCVVLVLNGMPVGVALVAATLAGMLAGLVTGLFHTACGIPAILAGILTQLALYSVNLRIMGTGTGGGKANQTVNLSESVYYSNSIAAAAVAAHECGHAVQHATAYAPLRMRSALVPVVSFASNIMTWVLLEEKKE
jgi:putative ABC transport system permease protein